MKLCAKDSIIQLLVIVRKHLTALFEDHWLSLRISLKSLAMTSRVLWGHHPYLHISSLLILRIAKHPCAAWNDVLGAETPVCVVA